MSIDWRGNLADFRTLLLLVAMAGTVAAIVLPPVATTRDGVDVLAVVDITGSMNVRDYTLDGKPTSRLTIAKAALKDMIGALPCPSRLGLALFSERVPFLLFEPIDVCKDYSAVASAIESIDWREGWEGDSHISTGLFRAIDMARSLKADLLFITDGQESPPLPISGAPSFDGKVGAVRGLIVGAGDYALSPIPKFDDRGQEIGFWGIDDVPHENRFGPPPADAESRPGYEARNAPFGAEAPKGTEHLSSVREPYLKILADQTGLTYTHMTGTSGLAGPLVAAARPRPSPGFVDLRFIPGTAALLSMFVLYAVLPLRERLAFARWRRPAKGVF